MALASAEAAKAVALRASTLSLRLPCAPARSPHQLKKVTGTSIGALDHDGEWPSPDHTAASSATTYRQPIQVSQSPFRQGELPR
jgi:hypothetical protein